jgi:hypothetical protein
MPTTTMPASLASLAGLARKQKSIAARNPYTQGEILHLMDFERAGRRIVRAGFPEPDGLLGAMLVGAPMVAADAITIAADTFATVKTGDAGLINPITGKKWKLGDMNEIAEKDLAIERGLLVEGLSFMRFERSGHWCAGTLKYVYDRRRRRIRWGEASYWDGDESDRKAEELEMQARFPAVAREAFAKELGTAVYGRPTTDRTRDLVDRMQHRLDVEFARQIENDTIGLLLEGPF